MKTRKKIRYTDDDINLAIFAKAISHPARVSILRQIASSRACFFNEISREFLLADSTVSQHISELKKSGLIKSSYEPPRVKYTIDNKNWKSARKYLKDFLKIPAGNNS